MAGRLRRLTPEASCRDAFGEQLRRWRQRRGLSQRRLGSLVLHSEETVAKVERAQRWPTRALAASCDSVLDTGGALLRLWPTVEQQRIASDGRHRRRRTPEDARTSPPAGGLRPGGTRATFAGSPGGGA